MIEEEKQLETENAAEVESAADADRDAMLVEDAIDPLVAEAAAATEAANEASAVNADALESLKATAETAQAQLEDFKQQYTRLAADFENFRKRTQKEKQDLEEQSKCGAIKELLPVVDNFERARSQIKPQNDGEMAIHKSYQGVYKQLVDALKRLGVAPMRPEGEMFDPNLHDAVMREETDEHPDGTVVEELMRGYIMGERVLRHAMVKVSTAPEMLSSPAESAESADAE